MKKYFEALAARDGKTPQEVYMSIQKLIDTAWASTDQIIIQNQIRLFGSRRKPTPEELVDTLARELLKNRNIVQTPQ